jgi:CDGSH-type Zn-finger protein
MAETNLKIMLIPNGPSRVAEGEVEITLTDGTIVTKEAPFFLCRCGGSKNKPFCDGTHKTIGFQG